MFGKLGHQPHAQPPTWRTRVPLFIWQLPWNLCSMDSSINTQAATGIVFNHLDACKSSHPQEKGEREPSTKWRWYIVLIVLNFFLTVNFDNTMGAIGFVSRIFPTFYPIAIIRADPHTGEPIRNTKGLCVRCKPGKCNFKCCV
jgi:hypothetical protein